MLTWVNGELVDGHAASIPALDRGLTLGEGIFETLKVVSGVPFALSRHLRRLSAAADRLGLPPPDLAQIRGACAQVAAQITAVRPHRMRITYTGGVVDEASGPLPAPDEGRPTTIVSLVPLAAPSDVTTVALVPWPRNDRGAVAGIKTTSFVENVVMIAHARSLGAEEALVRNTRGQLCEGATSNLFVVLGGRLLTPPLSAGCLPGVTRELVLEGYGGQEADLDVDVLTEAEELFMTSSIRDAQGVRAVTGEGLGRTLRAPGPVTREVAAMLAEQQRHEPDP